MMIGHRYQNQGNGCVSGRVKDGEGRRGGRGGVVIAEAGAAASPMGVGSGHGRDGGQGG